MLEELTEFIQSNPDPRELKRAITVQMRLKGYTALFRLVRYTTEVGTRHCRVPTAIEEQSGCTS